MPTEYLILVFGLTAAFAVSAVWGLWWAIRTGQMADLQRGAASIFDEDEPVGRPTDAFPGERHRLPGGPQSKAPPDNDGR